MEEQRNPGQRILRGFRLGAACLSVLLLGGCSRAVINYQIAESIGTVGVYENNEPVETPKMKAAREQAESQAAAEAVFAEQMDHASRLALGYYYDEAIAYLETIEQDELTAERIQNAIADYQAQSDGMRLYDGDIPHMCFPTLIEDTSRAFDGDGMSNTYSSSMITVQEFRSILESLYQNQYVLVDIHNIARLETDSRGITTMERQPIYLPEGKKPLVISQDNLNYSGIVNGDGIATRLVLNDEGQVKALYTDENGHDLSGDYDLIPVLEAFIEEHPDFSLRGAKGIVSVSGSEGVFGYELAATALSDHETDRQTVRDIAAALKKNGWSIACAGYSHSYMNDMTADQLASDIGKWKEEVGTLFNNTDILFYPYGAEVKYPGDELEYLLSEGLQYLCGLWGDTDYMELGENYMRQTRRFIDGYTLQYAGDYFTGFFEASQVLDPGR